MKELVSLLTQAVRLTFNSNFPVPEFQNLHVSPEFPILREDYPAIWVDFEPTGAIETAGIGDVFLYTTPDENDVVHRYKKWLFRGYATYTIMALTSLERDRLFDEVVKMIAFSQLNPQYFTYRQTIEDNPWIAAQIDFDQIAQRGKSATSGTPWGSDDILYEITTASAVIGEFASDLSTGEFILLDQVQFVAEEENSAGDPDGPVVTVDYPT
jgi:hypothetical protein